MFGKKAFLQCQMILFIMLSNHDPIVAFQSSATTLTLRTQHPMKPTSMIFMSSSSSGGDYDNIYDEDESLEIFAARERFEALMDIDYEEVEEVLRQPAAVLHQDDDDDDDDEDDDQFIPTFELPLEDNKSPTKIILSSPLTDHQRAIRHKEIELLARLEDGDDAVGDLWMLWRNEVGSDAADQLNLADRLIGEGPTRWNQAETILRDLVHDHDGTFTEPMNRLASLCYLKQNYQEAEAFCKAVLSVRPWHFGALSTIVMVYAAMPQQSSLATQWAAHRLPTFRDDSSNQRRTKWVQNAVHEAIMSLLNAEFHLDDTTTTTTTTTASLDASMEDAWQ